MTDRTSTRKSPIAKAIALLVVVAAVAVYAGRAEVDDQGPVQPQKRFNPYVGPEPAAGDDVIALLDGLKPGDEVAGLEVLAIDAPVERVVYVDVGTATKVFSVGISRLGTRADKSPPVTTDQYELTYGNTRGDGELPTGSLRNSAEAVAERIRRREHQVPTPEGL